MKRINARAWVGLACLALAMALAIFVPAGTLNFPAGWGYLAVFFGPSILITGYLMRHDLALLARRVRGGPSAEKQPVQKFIMSLASAGFVAMLVVPGLDYRFGWSVVPFGAVLAGDVLTVISFVLIFFVYRENTYTSATIEIARGQRVIRTGPYAVVRHPMYAGGLLLFIGMPLALGSYWAYPFFLAILPVLLWRLFDEERFLGKNLRGYLKYRATVRWRLVPGVF